LTQNITSRHFVLSGFSQQSGIRLFAFEAVSKDRSRTQLTVSADLSLIRSYGIHLQDLPMLCRELLESFPEADMGSDYNFTEADMQRHNEIQAAARLASAQKKKSARRPPTENRGMAWRAASPLGMRAPAPAIEAVPLVLAD
jgi:hypothetical protein